MEEVSSKRKRKRLKKPWWETLKHNI